MSTGREDLKELHGCVISLIGKILMDTSQFLSLEQHDLDNLVEQQIRLY